MINPVTPPKIKETYYHRLPHTTFTICVVTLDDGYMVSGESYILPVYEYTQDIGNLVAFEDALSKINKDITNKDI
jgi:hypothetical protein